MVDVCFRYKNRWRSVELKTVMAVFWFTCSVKAKGDKTNPRENLAAEGSRLNSVQDGAVVTTLWITLLTHTYSMYVSMEQW